MVSGRLSRLLLGGACLWAFGMTTSCERGLYRDVPSSRSGDDASEPAGADAGVPDASQEIGDGRLPDASPATDDASGDRGSQAPDPVDVVDAAASDTGVDMRIDSFVQPNCPVKVTDLTAIFGERIAGRVVAKASVNRYTKLMTERIGAHTTGDHFVFFERVGALWSKTDVSALSGVNPRTGPDACILSTATDVGFFGESNDDKILIQTWTTVSPAAELLLHLQFDDGPWSDCFSISGNAHQLVRSAPELLTSDRGMVVIGPHHDALVFRWGYFPPAGDDWQVRARLGSNFIGGFTAWRYDAMDSFAGVRDDGSIAIFRSTVLDQWKQDAMSTVGPRIVDVPLAWTSVRYENLAATSIEQHLMHFSHRTGEPWLSTDVTLQDGETAIGRVARYDAPGTIDTEEVLIARNAAGHLIYHWRDPDLRWHAFDVSRASKLDTPMIGDPAAWATPGEAAAAQGADGRLLVFDGLGCFRTSLPAR
jgi:hypothetical protein